MVRARLRCPQERVANLIRGWDVITATISSHQPMYVLHPQILHAYNLNLIFSSFLTVPNRPNLGPNVHRHPTRNRTHRSGDRSRAISFTPSTSGWVILTRPFHYYYRYGRSRFQLRPRRYKQRPWAGAPPAAGILESV